MSAGAAQIKRSRVIDDKSISLEHHRSLWQDAARRFRKNWLAVGGLLVVVVFLVLALIGPHIAPYDFLEQNLVNMFQGPSAEHFLGTDDLGRDVFSRMLHGARTAALVAFLSTSISLIIRHPGRYLVGHSRRANRRIADVDQRPDPGHAGLAAGHPHQYDAAPAHHQLVRHAV